MIECSLCKSNNRNNNCSYKMLIIKPKFCKFNLSAKESGEDSFYEGSSFVNAGSVHSVQQLSCEYEENVQQSTMRKCQKTEPLLHKKYNIDCQQVQQNKTEKTCSQNMQTRYSESSSNGNSQQNNSLGMQLSTSQIKSINKNVSCTNFILCSYIPPAPIKKNKNITIDQIHDFADSFDIILFKNKNAMSRMQRFVTQSQYDHVAMVVKIGHSRFLLQATAGSGVALSDFNSFLANYKRRLAVFPETIRYQIGYRRVSKKHKQQNSYQQCHKKLIQYLNKVLGKKYKYTPLYMLCSNYKKQQQTYFCSELIAECLKHCLGLKLQTPTYKILPKDFAQNRNVDEEFQICAEDYFQFFVNNMYESLRKVQILNNLSKIR